MSRTAFLLRDAMQSAVLPSQVVSPSVRPFVVLKYCDNTYRLEYFENSLLIRLGHSLSAYLNITDLLQREHPKS